MNETYLALGDSITAGYGVGLNKSFATQAYFRLLPNFPGLQYNNLGVNGLTSGELVSMLGEPSVRSLVRHSKVISITIGSNDLIAIGKSFISGIASNADLSLVNLNQNLRVIGERIRNLNPNAVVKIATIYNPLPLMNNQTDLVTQGLVKTANDKIIRMASEFRFTVVPVGKVFSGREKGLLGPDQLHPNVMGHRALADLFSQVN